MVNRYIKVSMNIIDHWVFDLPKDSLFFTIARKFSPEKRKTNACSAGYVQLPASRRRFVSRMEKRWQIEPQNKRLMCGLQYLACEKANK